MAPGITHAKLLVWIQSSIFPPQTACMSNISPAPGLRRGPLPQTIHTVLREGDGGKEGGREGPRERRV